MKFDHTSGQYFETGEARIYYERHGDANLPVLLFLHGGFGSIEDFNSILSGISQKFQILGIDTRGQGKSTLGSKPLTYEQIQKDCEQVLTHLKIDSFSVIGFSDGGIAAYRLAANRSANIRKLVVIGSEWHSKMLGSKWNLLSNVTAESWKSKFPDTYNLYQKLNPQPQFLSLAGAIVRMWLDTSSSGYPNDATKNISCPLLIIRGDEDHLTTAEGSTELARILKNASFFNIPFAGHVVFEEQTEIFLGGLNQFLNRS